MRILEEAGIYVFLTPLNRIGIGAENLPTWDNGSFPLDYRFWEYGFRQVDVFQQYSNTLGFMVPLSDRPLSNVREIPWSKAIVRDLKEYIQRKGYRSIPVATATYQYDMSTVPQYMNCGEQSSSADFLGVDLTYVGEKKECGNVLTWFESGNPEKFRRYSIPTFLLYGCNIHIRKDFKEIEAIFGDIGSAAFSGVIIFGLFDNPDSWNDYGRRPCGFPGLTRRQV
jgi:hypothetical protein